MKLRWSSAAERDLEEACTYIASDNPHAAIRVENRIVDAVNGLLTHPRKGRERPNGRARELVIVGAPYIVIYRLRGETVEILRVWHTSREPFA